MILILLAPPLSIILALLLVHPRPELLLWWLMGLSLALAVFVRLYTPLRPRWQLQRWLLVMAGALLGWQLAAIAQQRFSFWHLDANTPYRVVGTVNGLPDTNRYQYRIRLRLDCVATAASGCDVYRARISPWPVFAQINLPLNLTGKSAPKPGEVWQFKAASFKAPSSAANPGSFDVSRWYRANHLVARFRIKQSGDMERTQSAGPSLDRARLALRHAVQREMLRLGKAPEQSGLPVLLALVTGDRSLMTPYHWSLFNRTGTTHLVAISGTHIMLVAGTLILLFNLLLRRWLWLTRRVPANYGALVLGWLGALLYGAIAGMGLPVQRALIMLTVLVVMRLLGRARQLWFPLTLAFALVLLWDPMAVFAVGFWLSFLAVYWIIWISGGRVVAVGRIRNWGRIQGGITLGLAPVLLWQLQRLSLVSVFTNVFAIPLVGMILTPLALLWALLWGIGGDSVNGLLVLGDWITQPFMSVLDWFASTPLAVFTTAPATAATALLAACGILWLFTAGLPSRWLAPLLLIPLLATTARDPVLWLRDSGNVPQMALDTGNDVMFISDSGWPALIGNWQQDFLRYWGVMVNPGTIPVKKGADYWGAQSWVLTRVGMASGALGAKLVASLTFDDLCRQPTTVAASLQFRLLYRNRPGTHCVVQLQWAGQRWLLMSALSRREQGELLVQHRTELAVDHVLLHVAKQALPVPGLLRFWNQKGAELIIPRLPDMQWQARLRQSGVRYRVLTRSGPLRFPGTGQ